MGLVKKLRANAARARTLAAEKAARALYEERLAAWTEREQELASRVEFALAGGFDAADIFPHLQLRLRAGERVFLVGGGAALVGYQKEPSRFSSQSSSLGLNLGWASVGPSSRVEYREGEDKLDVLETGTFTLTSQRAVFQGEKYVNEWAFDRLIAAVHHPKIPWTRFQVSDQPVVSGILYDKENQELIRFRIDLAIADYEGRRSEVVASLQENLEQHRRNCPTEPLSPSTNPDKRQESSCSDSDDA